MTAARRVPRSVRATLGVIAITLLVGACSRGVETTLPPDLVEPTARPSEAPTTSSPVPTSTDVCGTSLQQVLDRADPGATVDVRGCIYANGATISKPVTLVGLTLALPEREDADRWRHELVIEADDVTIEGFESRGGANIVAIEGDHRDIIVRDADIRGQIGSGIWIKGGATDVLLERVTVVTDPGYQPSTEPGVSPIRAEGCTPWPCEPVARRITVRDSVVDQGPELGQGGPGWFGIELIRAPDSIIERTTIRGGHTRISLPNSDATIVRDNIIDMSGPAVWGVEVAGANDIVITGNWFVGDGTHRNDQAAISFNSTSDRVPTGAQVTGNVIRDVHTAFQLSGNAHRLTGNCLARVDEIVDEYGGEIGADVVVDSGSDCTGVGSAPPG